MNVTLSKRLPTFSLKLKNDAQYRFIDASGLYLNLKRISIDNLDYSLEIPLTNTIVDLVNKYITIKSEYIEEFNIFLSAYEIDQIEVILTNYINLLEERTTIKDLL